MTAPIIWTEDRDNLLIALRAEGRSWGSIGALIGISRWSAIERGTQIGARRPEIPREAAVAGESGRPPLPPGDAVSWGAITAGTVLEGVAYPLPPLSVRDEAALRCVPIPTPEAAIEAAIEADQALAWAA